MKFSGVLETDMRMVGQIVNMLQTGEYSLSGKDICASADTIRWLQKVVVAMADAYAESKRPETPPIVFAESGTPAVKEEKAPASGLGAGVTVKAFNPGKPAKAGKK